MILRTAMTLVALVAFSLPALAQEVNGTWKAEFDTQRGLQKYTFVLKRDGKTLAGKASVELDGQKREVELKDGKIEGDTVSFVETLNIQDREIRITYTGKVSADGIKFTRQVGDFGSTEAVAKREDAKAEAQDAAAKAKTDSAPTRRRRRPAWGRPPGGAAVVAGLAARSCWARTTSRPSRRRQRALTNRATASPRASWSGLTTTPRPSV